MKIHDDGVVIDGIKYRLFDSDTLPSQFSVSKAKMVKIRDTIYFHSESAYFSNLYLAPTIVDGVVYRTAEHHYQSLKCQHAKNNVSLALVLDSLSPYEAKKIGDKLPDSSEWCQWRDAAMEEVVHHKFDQNSDLADLLIATGTLNLSEATANSYFGVGATLHSREVRDGTHTGLNRLGLILEAERDALMAAHSVN